jgi:hypothetical protein
MQPWASEVLLEALIVNSYSVTADSVQVWYRPGLGHSKLH